VSGNGRANRSRVGALDRPELDLDDEPVPSDEGDFGEVRPALSPAQLAFLALIAALILTAIRRLRRRRV
jgi:GAF domain-containing protein